MCSGFNLMVTTMQSFMFKIWIVPEFESVLIKTNSACTIIRNNGYYYIPLATTVWFMIANAMSGGGRFNLTDTAEHTMTDHPFSQSGWIFDFAWKLLADDLLDLIRCLYQLEILTFLLKTTHLYNVKKTT